MTEDEIEWRVERMTDHLDRLLMSGQMTQRDYDIAMRDLNAWSEHAWRLNFKRESGEWVSIADD